MLLSNLLLLPGNRRADILTDNGKIKSLPEYQRNSLLSDIDTTIIKFNDAIAFPGLINSHDHLDFNLFPKLGNRIYRNYVEWGKDIHKQNKNVMDKVLKIPLSLRIQWGIYKNLFNGFTTVINHGPILPVDSNLIKIIQQPRWHSIHSIQLDKKWRYKLNLPVNTKQPYVIHIGEGTDVDANKEISRLIKSNLFKREIIGVHAIAMDETQATEFKAVIWCPASNHFLMGHTAAINKLINKTIILFGTDSTLSSGWNIWEHLRLARQYKMVTDEELFTMLTTAPAKVWKLPDSGMIDKGYSADLVIARKKAGLQGMDAFFSLNPEDILMVISNGNIRLFDSELHGQLSSMDNYSKSFCKVFINDRCKYVSGDISQLIKQVNEFYPEAVSPFKIP